MFNKFRKTFILAVGVATFGLFQSVNADWDVNDGGISEADPQDIVISLQSNPMSDPERACLAVTFARLLSSTGPVNDGKIGANVTLFVTLDGVTLGDKSVVSRARFKCDTPWGEMSLKDHLEMFLTEEDVLEEISPKKMVVCPLCWKSRYGDEELPYYGQLLSGAGIRTLMFNADKILDF